MLDVFKPELSIPCGSWDAQNLRDRKSETTSDPAEPSTPKPTRKLAGHPSQAKKRGQNKIFMTTSLAENKKYHTDKDCYGLRKACHVAGYEHCRLCAGSVSG